MQTVLVWARIILAIAFLSYASWSDWKTREVSNRLWMIFAPVACALTLVTLIAWEPSQLISYAVSFGLTAAISIALFYAGGFGGADAKALMCLALALPFYPNGFLAPLLGEVSPSSKLIFPITIFSNSVLVAALSSLGILFYNLSWRLKTGKALFGRDFQNGSIGRKTLILITGYKASVKKLKEKWHIFPLEDAMTDDQEGFARKLIVLPREEGRDAIVQRLEEGVRTGKIQNEVWATPGLPFLIFVTVGLLFALFLGDIIWIGIRVLLG